MEVHSFLVYTNSMDTELSDRAWDALLDDAAASIASRFGCAPATWAVDVLCESEAGLAQERGVFVTLTIRGQLRGCIGSIFARERLFLAVRHMALAAAFEDPRFPPLSRDEAAICALELSILSPLSVCPEPQYIEPGLHGVLLAYAGRQAVFLPQVATEQGWDRETLLLHLALKAGLPPDACYAPGARLSTFTALHRGRPAPLWGEASVLSGERGGQPNIA